MKSIRLDFGTTMGAKLGETELCWEDALVIACYFLVVLGVGAWSSVRSKRDSVSGYFLAGRSMHWIPVGASLFASNIGSEHFVGLSGSGASSGIAVAGFELNSMFVILVLGWIFVPVYMASRVYTMPEYLRKRFGGQRIRIYLSVLTLLLYVFTKISVDLYSGSLFVQQSIKISIYGSVLTLLAVSGIFTIAGGLNAVIWTELAQTILMVLGALALSVLSITKVGGLQKLTERFKDVPINETFVSYGAQNESCSRVPDNYMHLLKPPSDLEMPATGFIGLIINSVWYWCSDQVIVQRALSAKNLSHAKGGVIVAAFLKATPLFLIVFPGMASRILFPNEVACSNPIKCKEICGSEIGCTNIAYPKLVMELMPAGARGLMISVMLAALMSSLTSIFNSSSTIFTMDIWRRIRKEASETELLIVGRIFVLFLVAISIIWIPIVQAAHNSQLFHYIQSVISYLAPPISAVFVLAITYWRINEQGAFWGLMTGLVVGMIRFIWEYSYTIPSCGSRLPDPRPDIISKVHYLHFGIILFLLTTIVTVSVSLLTQPIHIKHLYRLTFWSRHSRNVRTEITKKQGPQIPAEGQQPEAFGVVLVNNDNRNNHLQTDCNRDSTTAAAENLSNVFKETKHGVDDESTATDPLWTKAFYCICGISQNKKQVDEEQKISPEEEIRLASDCITEKPLWNRICNTCALLVLVVCSFLWGYFA